MRARLRAKLAARLNARRRRAYARAFVAELLRDPSQRRHAAEALLRAGRDDVKEPPPEGDGS